MINRIVPWISGTLALTLAVVAQAGTTWDGGGSTDAKWTTPANWDGNTPPAFDGTADITIGTVHASGTLMVLDGDKAIKSLSSTLISPSFVITNDTLKVGEFIRKGNAAQIRIESDLEIAGSLRLRSDNSTTTGLLIPGLIKESSAGSDLIAESAAGELRILGTGNTYSGDTVVRRGILSVYANVPVSGIGPLGNSAAPVLLGDEQTGANNWPAQITIPSSYSFSRPIRVVDTGSTTPPVVDMKGSTGTRNFKLQLDRDVHISYGQPNNGTYAGYITGSGGFRRIGGVELLTLTCLTNDFSGNVSLGSGLIAFPIAGTTNGLGTASSAIVIDSVAGRTSRGLYASGTGTFSRPITLSPGTPVADRYVALGVVGASDVVYSGEVSLNTPDTVYFSADSTRSVDFTGTISGTSTPIRINGNTSTGNRIRLSNANNSFTGQLALGLGASSGCLFVGADSPLGGPGALGSHTTVNLNAMGSGVNRCALLIDGPYTVGKHIDIPNVALHTGSLALGGAQANTRCFFTGDVNLSRTNRPVRDCTLTAGSGGRATFTGKVSGRGNWWLHGDWNGPPAYVSTGGDVEFTNPANDFTGLIHIQRGFMMFAATGAEGAAGNGFLMGGVSVAPAVPFGVLTTGPATVHRGAAMDPHINTTADCKIGGITPDESRFTGDFNFTRGSTSGNWVKNYLFATNGATVHFDGQLWGGTGYRINKTGEGRVNINGRLLVPTFLVTAGILGGSGSMTNALTFGAGTTFSPGSPLGTLTVSNNVSLGANSAFRVQIANQQAGMADVHGNVTIDATGTSIAVPENAPCQNQVILRYHGTLTGLFSTNNLPSGAILDYGTGVNDAIRLTLPPRGTVLVLR